ncbi:MAG: glycosyltransferase family 39 protein, partial [Elusimicrobia bacterium]|nr:glycosyltransferase family 39 protein [Candidatus Obscuribacterium magneticum]
GYVYLKTGDFRYNGYHHPAFAEMWASFPLLFLKPAIPYQHSAWLKQTWSPVEQYQFADTFLFHNRVPFDRMMAYGRWGQLILSVLLGISLFFFGQKLAGTSGGLFSMGFWAFSPTFLAHGTLVTTDLAFGVFFFLFFASLLFWNSCKGNILSGIALGLCFASKYFSLSLLPILGALMVWKLVFNDRFKWKKFSDSILTPNNFLRALLIVGVGSGVLVAVYRGSGLGEFWLGLTSLIKRSQAGRSSFFLGHYGNSGWFTYFPFLFAVKTTFPVLLGLLVVMGLFLTRSIKIPAVLIIPPLLFFILACFSKVQIGHRHLLAVYPFIFLILGLSLSKARGLFLVFSIFLLVWQFWEAWLVKPYFLSTFNQVLGGPSQGHRYVTDSNVDWGQGLRELGLSLDAQDLSDGIYLCYFGVADPHAYGIKFIDVGSDFITKSEDDRLVKGLNPKKFAISVTHLQATYYANRDVFGWLKDYQPAKKVAHSIFVYDFKDFPEATARLKELSGYR